jgi:DNA-directed RNA polymerase specialized sigma24 family protein
MENTPAADIFETTCLLKAWSEGDETALERLVPLVDAELRRLARHYLRKERPDHILQTTALVNEAWVRLINWPDVSWQNRAHFIGLAAQLMRRVLVDEARRRQAQKYGADAVHVSLADAEAVAHEKGIVYVCYSLSENGRGSATQFTPEDTAVHPEIQTSTPGDRSVPFSVSVSANVERPRHYQGARYERNRRAS